MNTKQVGLRALMLAAMCLNNGLMAKTTEIPSELKLFQMSEEGIVDCNTDLGQNIIGLDLEANLDCCCGSGSGSDSGSGTCNVCR